MPFESERKPTPKVNIEQLPIPTIITGEGINEILIQTETIDGVMKSFKWLHNVSIVATGSEEFAQRALAITLAKWKLVLHVDAAIGFPLSERSDSVNTPALSGNPNIVGLYVDSRIDTSKINYAHLPNWAHMMRNNLWQERSQQTLQNALKHTPKIKIV